MNIKLNDTVLVITGKYKGKQGKVLKTGPKDNVVYVEGVNLVHKHEKARKSNETSRIVTEEGPIDASNVEVVCPACGKATRVGHKILDQKKHRVCKKCGAVLDKAYSKKEKKAAAAAAGAAAEAPKKRVRKRSAKAAEEKAAEKTEAVETAKAAENKETTAE